jgi:hypothetical protein
MLCSSPFKVPYICNGWGEGGGVLLAETHNILTAEQFHTEIYTATCNIYKHDNFYKQTSSTDHNI